ncbi:hypothetical protein [Sediminibacterium sp. TEGAF015]|uniref:hypothetical protein n=1 Tax=Sediminibacterium sp. TEGAF015 TaxID=575378 RepID=UPI0021F935AE|nr:hypothetical protein [Sediminibacterium sp. TEGAF015]BDQ11925.1 hypothetical protein TEGAF0_11420 [Sediminibacterium sp. TEGAF015]
MQNTMKSFIEYIPIFTTLFSIYFFREIWGHYQHKKTAYLLWWSLGVLTFGLGTLAESINALVGWSIPNVRYWYIVGALLGGYPLAQGSVYLLMKKKFADITSSLFIFLIVLASVFVILTPISIPENFDYKLSGKVFEWEWVRYFSPFINLYAFIFLVGGAVFSAIRYYRQGIKEAPFKGNIFIAIGGLLPGIGGSFTRAGYVEVLYVTEFVGLLLIYYGYRIIKLNKAN